MGCASVFLFVSCTRFLDALCRSSGTNLPIGQVKCCSDSSLSGMFGMAFEIIDERGLKSLTDPTISELDIPWTFRIAFCVKGLECL